MPEAASLRRAYIYPHRSARMLPRVSRRFAGAVAAAILLTAGVWQSLPSLLVVHNGLTFTLLQLARAGPVHVIDTAVLGRAIPVIVPHSAPASGWVPYGAAGVLGAALILLAWRLPLARGVAAFLLTILGASAAAYRLGATALHEPATFPVVWMHTELLVWLVLPSIAAMLFVTVQPSWLRGIGWMVAIEVFALVWSAARFVVVLGIPGTLGPVLLPGIWFAWGLLADVLYVTMFFSLAVHVNLRFTPERRG
jgi:hypothetical protein